MFGPGHSLTVKGTVEQVTKRLIDKRSEGEKQRPQVSVTHIITAAAMFIGSPQAATLDNIVTQARGGLITHVFRSDGCDRPTWEKATDGAFKQFFGGTSILAEGRVTGTFLRASFC